MRDLSKYISFVRHLKDTKQYQLAVRYAEAFEEGIFGNDTIRITIFECLLNLEQYERYIQLHDEYLVINPSNSTTYNNKGFALKKLFKYEEAIACYDRGLSFNPNSEALLDNKGLALAEMGQYAEALVCFNKAIESSPESKTAFNNKGSCLIKMGRYEEALEALEQAIANDPTSGNQRKHKAFALHKLKRYQEALESYEHSLGFQPFYVEAETCRALTYFDMKDLENCLISLKKVAEMRSNNYVKGFSQIQLPYLDRSLKKLIEIYDNAPALISLDNMVCKAFYEVIENIVNGNHGQQCLKVLQSLASKVEGYDYHLYNHSKQLKV